MEIKDFALIQRTLDGDQNAFTTLVTKYQKWVHTLIWRKIGDFHTAEEITQDVFLKVYKKLSTLKPSDNFTGWLYVIATRRCLSWFRKKQLPMTSLDATPISELEEFYWTQYEAERSEQISLERQRDLVKRLLEKLPESERTVVTLHYLAEMSCEKISEFLGVSPNTVKSRLHRARARLRKQAHLLHDASGIFQVPPTLTKNIASEISRIKPTTPSVNKPWLPWGLSFASTFLVILMIGMGPRALSRFQQPYNLDAPSEMIVELVEAPLVLAPELKQDVRNQHGTTHSNGETDGTGLDGRTHLLAAAHADTVDGRNMKPKWVQAKGPVGGQLQNFFLTSQGELYALGSIGLYRLRDDKTGWTLINDSLPSLSYANSESTLMAERGGMLYIATDANVLASTDRGVTWQPLGERPQGPLVALFITDRNQVRRPEDAPYEMYLVLSNGVFRSTNAGVTWHAFNEGLAAPEIRDAAAVENALFLATRQGLYRLNSGVWEKLSIAQARSVDALAVAGDRMYLNTGKQRDEQAGWLFTSDDFGDTWKDITPESRPSGTLGSFVELPGSFVRLTAIDETVFVSAIGSLLRSTDAGETWEALFGVPDSPASFIAGYIEAALDADTVFIVGSISVGRSPSVRRMGIGRSTDGGKTWHPFLTGMAETHVHQLREVDNALYAVTDQGITKSADGGETWTYVLTELFLPKRKSKPLSALGLSHMTVAGDALYLRAKQGGSTNCLLRLPTDIETLTYIEGMPVYVEPHHGEQLEQIADATVDAERNAADRAYLLGIEEAATRTTGEFTISEGTFYIEYERKLYRWTPGDREWHDTGMQDAPVFAGFYATNGLQVAASGPVVYLGKSNGSLFLSLDAGNTWTDVTAQFPLPLNTSVPHTQLLENLPYFKEIVFAGRTVYVSTTDGVAMSDDAENWHVLTDVKAAPIPMRYLAVDGTVLYGVSETGAYQLKKSTGTWIQLASEIPKRVTALVVAGNALYVGTEHRGVLSLPLSP